MNFILHNVCCFSQSDTLPMMKLSILLSCSSVSTIRNQRYHIHANLSFAILVAEILLLISARFEPGTVSSRSTKHDCTVSDYYYLSL